MTTIYLLVVKQPPTKENGCRACQFEDDWRCSLTYKSIPFDDEISELCPLQKVEVKDE